MAEVLAEHLILSHERSGSYACSNAGCGWELKYRCRMDDLKRGVDLVANEFAAHQASVLAANGYGKLEDAWDAGYDADNESWPDCAIPCGACEQCQKEPTANPYRRPE